jgi:hypothetical protein
MNKDQALAMLKFIADLYQIIQASVPDPAPVAEPVQNGREPEPEPAARPI